MSPANRMRLFNALNILLILVLLYREYRDRSMPPGKHTQSEPQAMSQTESTGTNTTLDDRLITIGSSEVAKSVIQEETDPFLKYPRVEPYDCVQILVRDNITTVVCVNDPRFNDISRGIMEQGAWEPLLSHFLIEAMLRYPTATLLDIGTNIGSHALAIAALGREVVAVDAVFYNLALLSHSFKRLNKGKIRIIYNSVSDVPGSLLYPYLEQQHRDMMMAGATYLVTKEMLDSGNKDWNLVIGPPVASVTTRAILDTIPADTVIVKIDIEGYECKALTRDIISGRVGKFIPYIFMEWMNLRLNRHGTCNDYQGFLNSFTESGYNPHDSNTLQPVPLETAVDWFDVIWVHRSAIPLLL